MKGPIALIVAGVVTAAVVVALMTTCDVPEEDAAAPTPAIATSPKPVAPRRPRAATGESVGEQAVDESDEPTPSELMPSGEFVVVPVEVVDGETGRPIEGATVTYMTPSVGRHPLSEATATADAHGHAQVRLEPAAIVETWTVAAGRLHSFDYVRTAPIGAAQPTLRIELAPDDEPGAGAGAEPEPEPTGQLRGVVRDGDGNPVDGARVVVHRADPDDETVSEPTDADGAYVIEGLTFGASYRARASGRSGHDSAESAVLSPTKEHPIVVADLRLRRYGTLELSVLDGEEEIYSGMYAKVSSEGRVWRQGGAFDSILLPPGRASLTVRVDGRAPVTETVDVPEGGKVKATVHVTLGETITGLVVDDAGAPVEDAWIRDGTASDDPREHRADDRSRADGAFELTLLAAGEHELSVTVPYEYDDVVVRGVRAPSENVRIVVARRGVLKLRAVFEDDAKPAPGARIAFHGRLDGEPWDIDRTLPQGGRFEIAWPAGVTGDVGIAVEGFFPVTRSVTVPAATAVDLGEIRLRPACSLTGVLRNEDGTPRAQATLLVRGELRDQTCNADSAGRFSFRGLAPGPLHIVLAEPPHASFLVDVPSPRDVVLVVPAGGLLQVFASNSSGHRLAARRVDVRDAHGVVVDSGETDANGSWMSRLAPGRYRIDVEDGPHGEAELRADDVTVLRLR